MNFTALVVEDDPLQREALADLLKDQGLEVVECTSAEARNSWLRQPDPSSKPRLPTSPCLARCPALSWPNMRSEGSRI
jgi:CheY-like chemotaxis protein